MRVLVACEFSGRARDAFARRGHDAWSCDLLPSEGKHIQGDARGILADGWDLLIAHPPCTRLCNSGVRWLHERGLWSELDAACELFRAFLSAPVGRVAVENPVMHGHASRRIGVKPSQSFHPWQFWAGEPGKGEVKRTCLWLRGLPPLVPTTPNEAGRVAACHKATPSADRWKVRSLTPVGVAEAMADQWGETM